MAGTYVLVVATARWGGARVASFGGRRRLALAGVVAAVVLAGILTPILLSGNSGQAKPAASPRTTPASSGPAVNPLTGLPGAAGKVLAVKIDNIVYARPQTGINYA